MARAVFFGPRSGLPEAALAVSASKPSDVPQSPSRGGLTDLANSESLRAAFDYRGDVTLSLREGGCVEGFVANLTPSELELWHRGKTSTQTIALDRIESVEFSGRDTADGRSYETWRKTHEAEAAITHA